MSTQILVDSPEFWSRLQEDIAAAKDHIYLQTLSFEGDSVGQALSDAVIASSATDKRFVSDEFYTKHRINDLYLRNPKHWRNKAVRAERDATLQMIERLEAAGVRVKLSNPSGFLHMLSFSRNHKKIIVIDNRISYLGGINFCEHNFAWHDMMVRFDDPEVAQFLKDDFLATWDGKHLNTAASFKNTEVIRFDGWNNEVGCNTLFERIASAKKQLTVVSPYITYPFWDALERARANGAEVTLITPEQNNWKALHEYILWECGRRGIAVQLYPERMMHLKAILIDDDYLLVGSSNFDFLSASVLQEIVAGTSDPAAIADFRRRVLEEDLSKTYAANTSVPAWKGHYHRIRILAFSSFYNVLHRMFARRGA